MGLHWRSPFVVLLIVDDQRDGWVDDQTHRSLQSAKFTDGLMSALESVITEWFRNRDNFTTFARAAAFWICLYVLFSAELPFSIDHTASREVGLVRAFLLLGALQASCSWLASLARMTYHAFMRPLHLWREAANPMQEFLNLLQNLAFDADRIHKKTDSEKRDASGEMARNYERVVGLLSDLGIDHPNQEWDLWINGLPILIGLSTHGTRATLKEARMRQGKWLGLDLVSDLASCVTGTGDS